LQLLKSSFRASTLLGGLHSIAWALHPQLFEKPRGIRQISD